MEPVDFDCPRCARLVRERFYGPCGACRDDLATRMEREAREAHDVQYEPKMNVVPNQVATKD